MGSLRPRALWSVCLALGCSTDEGQGPCWEPPAQDAPLGEVQLGASDRSGVFAMFTLDQDVTLVHGLQGGHHFDVRTQIRGMKPGVEGMTATRFSAFLEDGQQIDVFQCPLRWDYVEQSATDFLLLIHDVSLIVDEAYVPALPDTRVILRAEVIDAEGRYAIQEQSVIARVP